MKTSITECHLPLEFSITNELNVCWLTRKTSEYNLSETHSWTMRPRTTARTSQCECILKQDIKIVCFCYWLTHKTSTFKWKIMMELWFRWFSTYTRYFIMHFFISRLCMCVCATLSQFMAAAIFVVSRCHSVLVVVVIRFFSQFVCRNGHYHKCILSISTKLTRAHTQTHVSECVFEHFSTLYGIYYGIEAYTLYAVFECYLQLFRLSVWWNVECVIHNMNEPMELL